MVTYIYSSKNVFFPVKFFRILHNYIIFCLFHSKQGLSYIFLPYMNLHPFLFQKQHEFQDKDKFSERCTFPFLSLFRNSPDLCPVHSILPQEKKRQVREGKKCNLQAPSLCYVPSFWLLTLVLSMGWHWAASL